VCTITRSDFVAEILSHINATFQKKIKGWADEIWDELYEELHHIQTRTKNKNYSGYDKVFTNRGVENPLENSGMPISHNDLKRQISSRPSIAYGLIRTSEAALLEKIYESVVNQFNSVPDVEVKKSDLTKDDLIDGLIKYALTKHEINLKEDRLKNKFELLESGIVYKKKFIEIVQMRLRDPDTLFSRDFQKLIKAVQKEEEEIYTRKVSDEKSIEEEMKENDLNHLKREPSIKSNKKSKTGSNRRSPEDGYITGKTKT